LLGSTQVQELAPLACPHTAPPGQVPPQAGTCEMVHVAPGPTHVQTFVPLSWPQIWPLGQVPPHDGTAEISHV